MAVKELKELMEQLEALGTEQTKKIYMNHGAKEPLYGVRVGELKKLTKGIKNNNDLAIALYETGNYDAKYLSGMIAQPKTLSKACLEQWMIEADAYMISEYAVASVVATSAYALELAREWIKEEAELVVSGGWSTYSNYLSITPNDQIDLEEVRALLAQIKETIHEQLPRVRYTMNGFIISVGAYIPELTDEAIEVAQSIGKITVKLEKVVCKVPDATEAIQKVVSMERCGTKRKNCRC